MSINILPELVQELDSIPEDELENVKEFNLKGLKTFARFTKIYDGDTLKAIFPFNGVLYKWTCRLTNLDTPEIRTKSKKEKELAIKARDYLRNIVLGQKLMVECHEFDKYGRLLITIYDQNSENVSEILIKNGFGRSYDGGHKKKWFPVY